MATEWVYLNGKVVRYEDATIPVEDRGFIFGDGIYEVISYHRGNPFRFDDHWKRLQRSAAFISLNLPLERRDAADYIAKLLEVNDLVGSEATVYLQITRGVAPRRHAPPSGIAPTVLITARPSQIPTRDQYERGVPAITLDDTRWENSFLKCTSLLAAVMAQQKAVSRGAYESLLHRNGVFTEGSTTNSFFIRNGVVWTHSEGPFILSGITRKAVLELVDQEEIPVRVEPFKVADLHIASEIFLTGSTIGVLPITTIDEQPVAGGKVGPLTRRLMAAYERMVNDETAQKGP